MKVSCWTCYTYRNWTLFYSRSFLAIFDQVNLALGRVTALTTWWRLTLPYEHLQQLIKRFYFNQPINTCRRGRRWFCDFVFLYLQQIRVGNRYGAPRNLQTSCRCAHKLYATWGWRLFYKVNGNDIKLFVVLNARTEAGCTFNSYWVCETIKLAMPRESHVAQRRSHVCYSGVK